jgi:hypothetical protein
MFTLVKVRVEFTWLPEDVKEFLEKIRSRKDDYALGAEGKMESWKINRPAEAFPCGLCQ